MKAKRLDEEDERGERRIGAAAAHIHVNNGV
jgi:hypothetical protein